MVEIKIEIPKEIEEEIKNISETSISIAINRLIKSELEKLLSLKKLVSKSQLNEKDVKELSEKINESVYRKFVNYR
ncbi:MAG: hypothetical protein H5T44_00965 [Thermoplasmatales archaeon]|nr:hypothetical protein [Thermoplasmatales archaeon]